MNNLQNENNENELKENIEEVKPFTMRKWFVCMMIPTLLMLVLTLFVLKGSMYGEKESVVNYSETGDIDYKVYLKDNSFYSDKYLGKDMQYVASLIDKININYNYRMNTDNNLNYNYKYNIKADLLITDPNDNNKILYKKTTVLVDDNENKGTFNDFLLTDSVNIKYDEYNSYVNSFKKTYALSVKSQLVVTMEVTTEAKSKILKDDFNKVNKLSLAIPLSEQTIDIGIDTSSINNAGTLDKNYISQIKKPVVLILGLIVGILSLALLYISLYTLFSGKSKIDVYKSTINKILKDYDRAIVSSKSISSINEDEHNIIKVDSIEELLDAHDTTGQPILYSELVPNDVSCFVILDDKLLYKLVIRRKQLEKEERKRINERNEYINSILERFNWVSKIKNIFKKKNKEEIINEDIKEEELINTINEITNSSNTEENNSDREE